jgi:hypothetical protein
MALQLDCDIATRFPSPKERRDEDRKKCKREQGIRHSQLCTERLDGRPSAGMGPEADAGHVIGLNLTAMQRIVQCHRESGQGNGVSATEVLI